MLRDQNSLERPLILTSILEGAWTHILTALLRDELLKLEALTMLHITSSEQHCLALQGFDCPHAQEHRHG